MIFALFIFTFFVEINVLNTQSIDVLWIEHKFVHNLMYSDNEEEIKRKNIFIENLNLIKEYNEENNGATFEMNEFGHLTDEEFKLKLSPIQAKKNDIADIDIRKKIPEFVDWRLEGIVTEVKNQGYCGSCYAFSAIEAIESAYAKKTGKLINLSPQEIIDCAQNDDLKGCNGGIMDSVFDYVINSGISKEIDYKYIGKEQKCLLNSHMNKTFITGYKDISENKKSVFAAVAQMGPLSAGIQVTNYMKFYKDGILKIKGCKKKLDHGIVIDGYGIDTKKNEYIIIRNSWGKNWGRDGYLYIDAKTAESCGIYVVVSVPII